MPTDSIDAGASATLSSSARRYELATLFPGRQIDIEACLPGLLRVIDLAGLTAVGVAMAYYFAAGSGVSLAHLLAVVLGATVTVNLLQLLDAYSMHSIARVSAQLTKTAVASTGAFLGVMTVSATSGNSEELWGPWAIAWLAATVPFLSATRLVTVHALRRWRRDGGSIRRIAVYGTGQEAFALGRRLTERAENVDMVGVFIEGGIAQADNVAGDGERLAMLANGGRVDSIVIAMPWKSSCELNHTLSMFAASQVEIRIDPGMPELDYTPTALMTIGDVPTLIVQHRPLSGWGAPLKRLEDVILASILLVALSPLFLVICLLIKLDSRGPVLFRQERSGVDNRRIQIFKFRSMHHDPNPDPAVPQTLRNDPRVTRVGGLLRRSSLDELPQLLNVLRGEMSLVGPRPHAAVHNEKYARLIDGYLGRHRMKPGITGWAQVKGLRGGVDSVEEMKRRLDHDRYYVANWSLLLDIKILLMTVPAVFRGTNAY